MYKVLNKKHHGFTLIELLVVIAIIGILATVVLAGLGSQRQKANQTSALSSARSVVPVATICFDGESSFLGGAGNKTAGSAVCANTAVVNDNWPKLPTNFTFSVVSDTIPWSYRVTDTNVTPNASTTCNMNGCGRFQ